MRKFEGMPLTPYAVQNGLVLAFPENSASALGQLIRNSRIASFQLC